jgi:hypothetical protein
MMARVNLSGFFHLDPKKTAPELPMTHPPNQTKEIKPMVRRARRNPVKALSQGSLHQ